MQIHHRLKDRGGGGKIKKGAPEEAGGGSTISCLGWPKAFKSDPKEPLGPCLHSQSRLNPLKYTQNQQIQRKNGEGSEEKAPAD